MLRLRPQVGAGILIIQNHKILLAKRKGSHGALMWGSAGGHVEYGETPIETVKREAKEELGIILKNLKFLCCLNFIIDNKHYLDLGFTAEIEKGVPTIQSKEVDKIDSVAWFGLDNLPKPLFPPIKMYLKALETGQVYFE